MGWIRGSSRGHRRRATILRSMPSWPSIVREPLVHFVAIGAVLFAIDVWRSPDERAAAAPDPVAAPKAPPASPVTTSAPRSIVIDADARKAIAARAEVRLGRPASPEELAEETRRFVDEEILYREAVARGLDRDDPVVHARIAGKMSYVLEQALTLPEPTDAELRAWFDQHRDQWAKAERVDFTHVFFAGVDEDARKRAGAALDALAQGMAPERLGDRFAGGHRYRGRKLADLAEAFGSEFVEGLASQPVGTWVQRRSRYGYHLVRVDRVDAASAPDFADARLDVRKQWLEARKAQDLDAAMRKLRETWTVENR
jgi:peptidyl-prolyl cis-trans isomerase C